jgi:ubiquinone/menaquinone biosynthesis C-methylase UbiE
VKTLLRFFFRLLYHQFAFTYDLVAATVSFNRWNDWVMSVIPFIEGRRVLEIGHGPGHLQRALLSRGLVAVGIDESAQMGRLARLNLARGSFPRPQTLSPLPKSLFSQLAYTQTNLTRGVAQHLPFPNETFDAIVATFPTEYITEADTLAEVKRCLRNAGRLIVLPVALPQNALLDWLFKVTHQSPTEALEVVQSKLREPFLQAGFEAEIKTLDMKSGILLIVLATKPF